MPNPDSLPCNCLTSCTGNASHRVQDVFFSLAFRFDFDCSANLLPSSQKKMAENDCSLHLHFQNGTFCKCVEMLFGVLALLSLSLLFILNAKTFFSLWVLYVFKFI